MWIKMLRDQVGPDGIFRKGQAHSLPQAIVKKLDVDSYVQVDVDEHAMLQLGAEERLRHLGSELATFDSAIDSANKRLADLKQRRKTVRAKIRRADDELEQLKRERDAKSKTETDNREQPNNGSAESTEEAAAKQPTEETSESNKSVA